MGKAVETGRRIKDKVIDTFIAEHEGTVFDGLFVQGLDNFHRKTEFTKYGFSVLIHTRDTFFRTHRDLIHQHTKMQVYDNDLIGEIHFTPQQKNKLDPKYLSLNLASVLAGGKEFFDVVDKGFPNPEFLCGKTKKQMAEFAQRRLGFTAIKGEKYFVVVGRTADVRARFEELTNKETQITQRAEPIRQAQRRRRHYVVASVAAALAVFNGNGEVGERSVQEQQGTALIQEIDQKDSQRGVLYSINKHPQ